MKNSIFKDAKAFIKRHAPSMETIKAKSKSAYAYAKENPDDVMLAGLLCIGIDAKSSLDEIEDATEVSATLDVHEYFGS